MNAQKEATTVHQESPVPTHSPQDEESPVNAGSEGRSSGPCPGCQEPGTSSTSQEKVARHELLFSVQMSIRYHSKRQGFFEGADQVSNFLLLMFSSAAVAAALKDWSDFLSVGIGIGIALITSMRIAFRVASKAARHSHFVTEYTNLERELRYMDDEDEIASVWDSRLNVESEEPPTLINLSKVCHNEVIASQDLDPSYILPLSKPQRFLAPIWDLNPYKHGESAS